MVIQEPQKIAQTRLWNGRVVRTVSVFEPSNYSEKLKHPFIFETAVFPFNSFQEIDTERYSTWEEAQKGHNKMIWKWSKKFFLINMTMPTKGYIFKLTLFTLGISIITLDSLPLWVRGVGFFIMGLWYGFMFKGR